MAEPVGYYRPLPDQCTIWDWTLPVEVEDWPEMSHASKKAFKNFTGLKFSLGSALVRKGKRIFRVDSTKAVCVYNHTREF